MAALARPHAEDLVIHRRLPALFEIGVSSGTPQLLCSTFEEALQRAGRFASGRHVHVWFTTDDQEFVLLAEEPLLRRIWGEYAELPGLRLTRQQAQRLWAVDESTCTALLESLVSAKLLVQGADGRYARHVERSSPPVQTRMAKADVAPPLVPSIRRAS